MSFKSDGVVAACIAAVTVAALYFFYSRGLTNIYGDAIAHMEGARRIFDSLTPGYEEIGSVWLPLFHLLAAPLALSDFLWRTGLAGSIVSSAAFAGTAWLLYRLGTEINGGRSAGVLALAGVLLSPNLLYLASTPLTEPLAIFWAVLVVYELFRYRETGRLRALLGAAGAAFLGTLTRYEEWYVLPFAALFVLLARRQSWESRIRHALVFSLISGAGPCSGCFTTPGASGIPWSFTTGHFRPRPYMLINLPPRRFPIRPTASFSSPRAIILRTSNWSSEYGHSSWPSLGWLHGQRTGEFGGGERWHFCFWFPCRSISTPLLMPPFRSTCQPCSLSPITICGMEWKWSRRWRFSRPSFFLEVCHGVCATDCWRSLWLVLAWQSYSLLAGGAEELAVVKEGILNTPCRSPRQQAIIRFLRDHYDGQRMLVAAGKWPCVMPEVGIPYRNTITETNRKYWRTLRPDAGKWVEWIIRGDGDAVDELMRAYPQAFADFELLERDSFPNEGSVAIYRRRDEGVGTSDPQKSEVRK